MKDLRTPLKFAPSVSKAGDNRVLNCDDIYLLQIVYAMLETAAIIVITIWLTWLANAIAEGGADSRKHLLISPDLAIAAIAVAAAWALGEAKFKPNASWPLGIELSFARATVQVFMIISIAAISLVWAIRIRQLRAAAILANPPSPGERGPSLLSVVWMNRHGVIPLSISLLFVTLKTSTPCVP